MVPKTGKEGVRALTPILSLMTLIDSCNLKCLSMFG